MCNPGTFQNAASALRLGARDVVCTPFKSFFLFSGYPRHKFYWFSKPDIMGAHLPSAGPPGCWAWTSCSSERASVVMISLLLVGHQPRGVHSD